MLNNKQLPVVAHLRTPFLSFSETFIYNFLKNIQHFRSLVFTIRLENSHTFDFQDVYLLQAPWIAQVLWRRIFRFESSALKYLPWYPAHILMLRKHRVNLLHAHFGTTGYFAWSLKKFYQVPLVTSFYGADVTRIPNQAGWTRRYRRLFADGEQFTVNSHLMKQRLINLGCSTDKITVIRTGVNLEKFKYYPRQIPGPDEPVCFLITARFVEKKGIEYAIRAFAQLRQRYPHTELRIIGDGPLRPRIEQLIADLGLGDGVKLLGFQPHDTFVKETRHCHILVQASVTAKNGDQEGVPVTMVEAHAAGMPIIASNHSGNPEAMVDQQSGFLTPERDVEALAAKMIFFVEHPETWSEMGFKGRQYVERHYDVRREALKLESVYKKALYNNSSRTIVSISNPPWLQ